MLVECVNLVGRRSAPGPKGIRAGLPLGFMSTSATSGLNPASDASCLPKAT